MFWKVTFDVLDFFSSALLSCRYMFLAAVVGLGVVIGAIELWDAFIGGCRRKPERAELLAALIRSWLTK